MNRPWVTIYCLPNIRRPWVLVFEPHPWGCGPLRVKESSAVLIWQRATTVYETRWLDGCKTYMGFTFDTESRLLEYEDGQHEHAVAISDAIAFRRKEVDAVLAKVAKKQAVKAAEERKRTRLRMVNDAAKAAEDEGDDDPDDSDV